MNLNDNVPTGMNNNETEEVEDDPMNAGDVQTPIQTLFGDVGDDQQLTSPGGDEALDDGSSSNVSDPEVLIQSIREDSCKNAVAFLSTTIESDADFVSHEQTDLLQCEFYDVITKHLEMLPVENLRYKLLNSKLTKIANATGNLDAPFNEDSHRELLNFVKQAYQYVKSANDLILQLPIPTPAALAPAAQPSPPIPPPTNAPTDPAILPLHHHHVIFGKSSLIFPDGDTIVDFEGVPPDAKSISTATSGIIQAIKTMDTSATAITPKIVNTCVDLLLACYEGTSREVGVLYEKLTHSLATSGKPSKTIERLPVALCGGRDFTAAFAKLDCGVTSSSSLSAGTSTLDYVAEQLASVSNQVTTVSTSTTSLDWIRPVSVKGEVETVEIKEVFNQMVQGFRSNHFTATSAQVTPNTWKIFLTPDEELYANLLLRSKMSALLQQCLLLVVNDLDAHHRIPVRLANSLRKFVNRSAVTQDVSNMIGLDPADKLTPFLLACNYVNQHCHAGFSLFTKIRMAITDKLGKAYLTANAKFENEFPQRHDEMEGTWYIRILALGDEMHELKTLMGLDCEDLGYSSARFTKEGITTRWLCSLLADRGDDQPVTKFDRALREEDVLEKLKTKSDTAVNIASRILNKTQTESFCKLPSASHRSSPRAGKSQVEHAMAASTSTQQPKTGSRGNTNNTQKSAVNVLADKLQAFKKVFQMAHDLIAEKKAPEVVIERIITSCIDNHRSGHKPQTVFSRNNEKQLEFEPAPKLKNKVSWGQHKSMNYYYHPNAAQKVSFLALSYLVNAIDDFPEMDFFPDFKEPCAKWQETKKYLAKCSFKSN